MAWSWCSGMRVAPRRPRRGSRTPRPADPRVAVARPRSHSRTTDPQVRAAGPGLGRYVPSRGFPVSVGALWSALIATTRCREQLTGLGSSQADRRWRTHTSMRVAATRADLSRCRPRRRAPSIRAELRFAARRSRAEITGQRSQADLRRVNAETRGDRSRRLLLLAGRSERPRTPADQHAATTLISDNVANPSSSSLARCRRARAAATLAWWAPIAPKVTAVRIADASVSLGMGAAAPRCAPGRAADRRTPLAGAMPRHITGINEHRRPGHRGAAGIHRPGVGPVAASAGWWSDVTLSDAG